MITLNIHILDGGIYILTFYGGICICKFISFIQRMFPDLARKITGMLLELDNSEVLHMLEHHESLKSKVEEAVAVLQAHQNKPPQES